MSYKLLIVDDNRGCDEMFKTRFEVAGYDVKVVYTAEEAIEVLKNYHPEAILLDLLLPKMQGDELLNILKSDPKTKDIKVMVLTALHLDSDDEDKIRGKADDFVLKIKIMPKELTERMTALIESKKTT
jgi:CheY-like chemotaxis protein